MKKFIILMLAAIFCLAMSLPASAEVVITGMASVDIYSHSEHGQRSDSGFYERDTQIAMWPYTNYIRTSYENKEGTLGGTFQFYIGRRNDSLARQPNTTSATGALWTVDFGNNHIWWKPMPMVKLMFGSQAQIVGGMGGPGIIGGIDVTCCNIGAGNLHSSNKLGITADIKFNDIIGLEVGIYDPDDDDTPAVTSIPAITSATTGVSGTGFIAAEEENVIPRFDIGLPLTFGSIGTLKPKFAIVERNFDHVCPGSDDDYLVWALSIDGSVKFGPVTFSAEISTGENIADANLTGGSTNAKTYMDSGGHIRVEDTEAFLWWAHLNWKITPKMQVSFFYGELHEENDVSPLTVTDDWELDRKNYGITFIYNVLPNFQIRPSWNYWDYGDSNLNGTADPKNPDLPKPVDNGKESVIGIGFLTYF